MKCWTLMRTTLVAITLATICSGCVLPPVLHKQGEVCKKYESTDHGHSSTWEYWKIDLHSHLQVDFAGASIWRNFIKVLNTDPTTLQKIDMHVVNRGKKPIPHGLPYGCPHTEQGNLQPDLSGALDDFVFAFGIGVIDNGSDATEPRSPHMLIYLPLHTKPKTPPDAVQEFRILLLHMDRADTECTGDELTKQRCEALKSIRTMWETEGHSVRNLKKAAAANIQRIITD